MQDILSYDDIVLIEGFRIQKGINVHPKNKPYTVLLMSVSENSPYNDGFDESGEILSYEGEDINTRRDVRDDHNLKPKDLDQPMFTKKGNLTNNGKLFISAEDYKFKRREKAESVRVYEKISPNVWSDKGWFDLVDVDFVYSEIEKRKVFKYKLLPKGTESVTPTEQEEFEFSRRIPTIIKQRVWERDQGKCVDCGSTKDLHFDHIIPFSKGGSSRDIRNVQLLCAKHNLFKSDRIQ
ncbi:HNH endonuclease [Candidatus Parcubacteria bacterium]|uniref:HNH endonuclease n=1 Tax=Candidatus Kaiserbacteria bacterium CG10_big_fil_rev_8_21_14_0_10_47_16 TaxID=1974608 RepID=A0A2H0UEH3_9BACT|nr:HNH endonuclease [Candidatus Parcubacteria bacterium]PIR84824.1 MAG: HNH endonuclease [Candidatus Kaiserbacteria bacterium CG10_big_fil_rev_8_21_14_0_10_47_16]